MPLPNTFGGLPGPIPLGDLDENFAALGALTAIPCVIAGTSALTLTPAANTPAIVGYEDYQPFTGVATSTNTGSVTAQVGGLAALSIYKDTGSGPAPLSGGEIVVLNLITLLYDAALNSGAGGFHLRASSAQPATGAAPVTTSAGVGITYAASILTGSGTCQAVNLRTGGASGDFNDTTATASALITSIPGCGVNTYFRFRILNSTGHTQTLLAGSGVTVSGVATTANNVTHDFVGVVISTASPAVTIYG